MIDILLLGLVVLFFIVSIWYVNACSKLMDGKHE